MYEARLIPAEHKDIVHDVSFDFYGRRMATCSSDHTVKIWDIDEFGEWVCTADWKAHAGPVWRVAWANPEFGQVIATCSFDRTAVLWEEQVGDVNTINSPGRATSQWIQRAPLVDSSIPVTDIEFAPRHLGLLLAMCYKDGIVRIYEAPDPMNLSYLSVQHVINCKLASASCISWNPSRSHAPMLAVGSDDPSTVSGGKVEILCYSNATRKWCKYVTLMGITEAVHDVAFAPNVGRSRHLLAISTKDVNIMSIEPLKERDAGQLQQSTVSTVKPDITLIATLQDHETQVWRVEWNLTGTILSSTGDDGRVRLWKANYIGTWRCIGDLKNTSNAPSIVGAVQQALSQPTQQTIDLNSLQKPYQ